jgi:hypothetical protein
MTTYRAVQATTEGKFELVERELTDPGPGQVRAIAVSVRTAAAATSCTARISR